MATTSSFYAPTTPSFDPFLIRSREIKPNSNVKQHQRHRVVTTTYAARKEAHHNQSFSGRLVDENLIVLRKRIREMKMIEKSYEPPVEWMDWEKQLYGDDYKYGSLVSDFMYHLQSCLMETRPSLVLSIILMVALSLPTSTAVIVYNLLKLVK